MEMLQPSATSMIGLHSVNIQTKVSVVCDGKTKICYILFQASCSHTELRSFQRHKNKTPGFCLQEEATTLVFWEK